MKYFVIYFGNGFAHGLPLEFEAKSVVDDTIENGVCEGQAVTSKVGHHLIISVNCRRM